MIECQVCHLEVNGNRGGQFTLHLSKKHNMSLEQYVIQTEYQGIPPVCACGLCEEKPVFSRGMFLSYAMNHRKFEIRENLYKERYGVPRCKTCEKPVGFYRGEPKRFCDGSCAGKMHGFSLPHIQEKIRSVVQAKYGVDNVRKTSHVRKKVGDANKGRHFTLSNETKRKISKSITDKWNTDDNYRQRMSEKIFSEEEKTRRSNRMKLLLQDPEFRRKSFTSHRCKLSKLHMKIKDKLGLHDMGFISEQHVQKYIVDEFHEQAKICIEINGDYIHANPRIFKKDDIIRLRGNAYTAEEKWKSDKRKFEFLQSLGYTVIVIWESDDLNLKFFEIQKILRMQLVLEG